MSINHQNTTKEMLSPQQVREKSDILETNLFRSISQQTDPSKMQIKINRTHFPDAVINKALLQLMPRLNINPRNYLLELRELLQKKIPPDKQERFTKELNDTDEILYDDVNIITRRFEATASDKELEIIVTGVPEIKSADGKIVKSFFNHEESPGKLLKDGTINFKEINKYPIVSAGDNLFYISHEQQGKQGISFEGGIIPVDEAVPYAITIGSQVKKVEDSDKTGKPGGYFLEARTTGVVILDRDDDRVITGIDISDEIETKKLDYSTGNIGTEFSCPIRMKIGVICNGFKLRVRGKVEATIVDGGEIITDQEAVITKTQSGSSVMALKDICIASATNSKVISEKGTATFSRELIDSEVSAPRIVFKKNKGLITNNKIETENLSLTGLYFSGKNIIHFGHNLFAKKKALMNSRANLRADRLELINTEKVLMEKLQLELKRMTKLTVADPELVKHIKPIIMATKTMDYEIIFMQMDLIQKRNNTKVIATVRKLFEALEKIPQGLNANNYEESTLSDKINKVNRRAVSMRLSIEGFLRRAATIKIYCGYVDPEKTIEPDFMAESDDTENKFIKVTGTYSLENGFEFVQ